MTPPRPARAMSRPGLIETAIALAMVTILGLSWGLADTARLSRLILPDADDMMRLAQIRDWIGGQAMNDWTQYRMAPPMGSPMHWSRLNDLIPAASILTLTPIFGRYLAELVTVVGYPLLLLFVSMLLGARIARRLWGERAGVPAVVLAGLAYPGTTLFIPGRIDHHALQVVVIQIAVLALMTPGRVAATIAGLALACSTMIGLETAPQVVALIGVAAVGWAVRGQRDSARLTMLAAGYAGLTLVFYLTMRPTYWSDTLCDAFTPASASAIILVSGVLALLAWLTPRLTSPWQRLGVGASLGGLVIALVLARYPACMTGPYGQVSPFLRIRFIAHIDEANSIFAQTLWWRMVSLAGLMAAGLVACGWTTWHASRRWPLWAPIAAVVVVSGLITLSQVRGVYIGAPLSVPLLAGWVVTARRDGRPLLVVAAWLAGAGVTYLVVPSYIDRWLNPPPAALLAKGRAAYATPQMACNSGDTWEQVDRLPAGVVMAPTNMASYMIGATHMKTVGAGYHRNDRANMDMYRYFLSPPGVGDPIVRAWRADYVMFCPGDFSEIKVERTYPNSLATVLTHGGTPPGFVRVPLHGTPLRLYRRVD